MSGPEGGAAAGPLPADGLGYRRQVESGRDGRPGMIDDRHYPDAILAIGASMIGGMITGYGIFYAIMAVLK